MNQLRDFLNLDALTVTQKTVGENIKDAGVKNHDVIRSLDNPVSQRPGVAILRGNLAPDGAIVKLSAVPGNWSSLPAQPISTKAKTKPLRRWAKARSREAM